MFGSINYAHSFELSDTLPAPVDTDYFLRYFREKQRLCWKEIYLKFSSIMIHNQAELCTTCCQWFQISEIATCQQTTEANTFHTIDVNRSQNQIDKQGLEDIKR